MSAITEGRVREPGFSNKITPATRSIGLDAPVGASQWKASSADAASQKKNTAPAAEPSILSPPAPKVHLPPLESQRIQVAVRVRPLPNLKPHRSARQVSQSCTGTRGPKTPTSRRVSTAASIAPSPSPTPSVQPPAPTNPLAKEPCISIGTSQPDSLGIADPSGRRGSKEFAFDAVFADQDDTTCVYERMVKGLVEKCLEGYNGCVFAYGQTASGKTYTMEGYKPTPLDPPPSAPEQRGIMLRVAADIVDHIRRTNEEEASSKSEDVTSFCVKATYLEIYQETLTDLLCDKDGQADLRIRMDPDSLSGRELYVQGLTEREVVDIEDYVRVAQVGAKRRTVGETNMNEASSRSHAVFTLIIEQIQRRRGGTLPEDIGARKRSKIHLVDLAGSERAKDTGAVGTRLKEGGSINQSLLSLGNVISALSAPTRASNHVSYRDSKLTYLLSDSLGGNALTVMIACISPAGSCYEETMSTLRFAERAKKVKLRATVNIDMQSLRILALESEISHLRSMLASSFTDPSFHPTSKKDAGTSMRRSTGVDAETSPMENKRSPWAKLKIAFKKAYANASGALKVRPPSLPEVPNVGRRVSEWAKGVAHINQKGKVIPVDSS
ncbi:P-loop containing nucleoside triphosphate hydrolase protein [Fimicolochytrium jonesii]|uniref:P-loop containing nucleoside triphosphate hydrolase protein n=1 Tax=Fimicolochytrium jonesii TaxID=1396493 RepID=UPI0022FE5261|nr:P-loop containing nucleoside triphosphate hydrolase protein [Fimicolochytrium jonesii]KAI8816825.1 P-loop containing nucleoside triphosphate hydrolase protein [Fimicolochytrium jonesii]